MRRRNFAMRLWWLMPLCIAGCSPYNYAREVTDFSTGVDDVASGYAAGYAALATDRAAAVQHALADSHARVKTSPSCLEAPDPTVPGSDAPCLVFGFNDQPSQPTASEQYLIKTKGIVTALQDYSHALAAVTNAADRAAYDAAVAKLADSLGSLASAAGPSGAAISKVVPPAINLLGWLGGTALDNDRFETLKAAPGGQSPMQVITSAIGKGLLLERDEQLRILNGELSSDRVRLGPGMSDAAYRQRLAAAEALSASIEVLRETDPIGTANKLNDAHDALVKAVNDPSRNVPALVKAITQFTTDAQALNAALKAGAAPTTTPSKGA
jgi:hypothetical protein